MSKVVDIFVSPLSPVSIDEFAQRLGNTFGVRLFPVSHPFYVVGFVFDEEGNECHIGTHPFDNTSEFNFEDYPYRINVVGNGVNILPQHEVQLKIGHTIFETLRAQKLYRLMLVDDLQLKLDEFDPQAIY